MFLNCIASCNVRLKICSDFFSSMIDTAIMIGNRSDPKIVIKVNNVSIFLPQETLLMIIYIVLLCLLSIKNVIFQYVMILYN